MSLNFRDNIVIYKYKIYNTNTGDGKFLLRHDIVRPGKYYSRKYIQFWSEAITPLCSGT